MRKIAIIVIMALLCIATVSALGIAPGKYSQYFEPNKGYKYSFWVVNDEYTNTTVNIEVTGELAKYITLHNTSMSFNENETFKRGFFTVQYPADIGLPGPHTANIVIKKEGTENETRDRMNVVPSIESVFEALVPYDGSHLQVGYSVEAKSFDQPISFIFPLKNLGTEEIKNIHANVEVYENGEIIATAETKYINLSSKNKSQLRTSIEPLPKGEYTTRAYLYHDSGEENFTKEFTYGDWVLKLNDITVAQFELGGIILFNITVSSDWNTEADSVYADLILSDIGGYYYERITSVDDIDPQGSVVLEGFWDTEFDVIPGEYFLTLAIHNGNKSKRYMETIQVEEYRIISRYHTPPLPIHEKLLPDKYVNYIINAIIALGIFIFAILLFFILIKLLPTIEKRVQGTSKSKLEKPLQKIDEPPRQESSFKKMINTIASMKFVSRKKRSRRIKHFKKIIEKSQEKIEKARSELLLFKRAIDGLDNELKKGIINKKIYDGRLDLLLDGKGIEYWEQLFAHIIADHERRIKDAHDDIWKEG